MAEPDGPSDEARLRALEARLAERRAERGPAPPAGKDWSQSELAWRMVIEMVAGLMIGFGIGYGIDVLAGTLPVFMVVFTLLGLAAGIRTMLRSAAEVQRKREAAEAARRGGEGG